MIEPRRYSTDARPLSASYAPASKIVDLFHRNASRLTNSRREIRLCQMIRRNLTVLYAPDDWVTRFGEDAAQWIEPSLPERKNLTKNLTNALSDQLPTIVREALGTTDPKVADAEQLERLLNAALEEMYDHEEVIGKSVEDGEHLTVVQPDPTALLYCPQYMESDGKGGRRVKEKYGPDLRGRQKHREDMRQHFATNCPVTVRTPISALDCAPAFVHGRHRQRFQCQNVVIRTLYDPEELIEKGYGFKKDIGDRLLVPRAYGSGSALGNPYGKGGQVYLYEGFVMGKDGPFLAMCIGGNGTWNDHAGSAYDPESSIVVDLANDYGIDYPIWHYDWGIHSADDDPDFRGIPFMSPLVESLLNVESLLLAHNAQTHENAFSGHVTELSPDQNPEKWMEGGKFIQIRRPRTGEITIVPGPVTPFVGAPAGDDARYLEQFYMGSMRANTPSEAQFGGEADGGSQSSGRQLVVERGLFQTAHRQIPACGLRVAKFIAETSLKMFCGLARGRWKGMKAGVNVAFAVNIEAIPGMSDREASDLIEFNERWVGGENYAVKAEYPSLGNIAEVGQIFELYLKGGATWEDLMKARGKSNPMAERIKRMLDDYWNSDMGKAELLEYAMKSSGRIEQAKKLEMQRNGEMTPDGMPMSAVAPEALAPPVPQGAVQMAPGNPAASILGGELAAGLGTQTLGQEASLLSQIGAPTAAIGGGSLPAASGMGGGI